MTLIVWHFWFFSLPQLSGGTGCCCCWLPYRFYPFSHFFALSIFFISNPSMSMTYNSIFLPWLSFLIYTFPPFLPFVYIHTHPELYNVFIFLLWASYQRRNIHLVTLHSTALSSCLYNILRTKLLETNKSLFIVRFASDYTIFCLMEKNFFLEGMGCVGVVGYIRDR